MTRMQSRRLTLHFRHRHFVWGFSHLFLLFNVVVRRNGIIDRCCADLSRLGHARRLLWSHCQEVPGVLYRRPVCRCRFAR